MKRDSWHGMRVLIPGHTGSGGTGFALRPADMGKAIHARETAEGR